jgi:hypothetical protein
MAKDLNIQKNHFECCYAQTGGVRFSLRSSITCALHESVAACVEESIMIF